MIGPCAKRARSPRAIPHRKPWNRARFSQRSDPRFILNHPVIITLDDKCNIGSVVVVESSGRHQKRSGEPPDLRTAQRVASNAGQYISATPMLRAAVFARAGALRRVVARLPISSFDGGPPVRGLPGMMRRYSAAGDLRRAWFQARPKIGRLRLLRQAHREKMPLGCRLFEAKRGLT